MAIRYNSCVKEGWDYTEGKWIVSLLNTGDKLSGHAVIVVERVEDAIPSVGQYDLKSKIIRDETYGDTVQRATGNAQGYIAEIRAIFITSTFATSEAALKPLDCPAFFESITSFGFAA